MTIEQLITDTLAAHAQDAPDPDEVLAAIHTRLTPRRWRVSVAASLVAAAIVALGAVVLTRPDNGTPVAAARSTAPYHFLAATGAGTLIPAQQRRQLPAFTGRTIDGQLFRLRDTHGRPVVVTFLASWCGPCQVDVQALRTAVQQAPGVRLVGVDLRDAVAPIRSFATAQQLRFPIVFDPDGRLPVRLGDIPSEGLPFTLLLDRQHRVAALYIGPSSAAQLRPALRRLAAGG